ncbi:hypothetical protein [Embleya sp. NPDC020630]|uniref:hypothetical protein n=1 Tax=Embleya sp. NPDC020630 TaxID=3363979 RepID=UPI0037B9F37E
MRDDRGPTALDELLGDAATVVDAPDIADLTPRRSDPIGEGCGHCSPAERMIDRIAATDPGTPAPSWARSEHEQAAHELGVTAVLVLNRPGAAASLSRLVDTRRIDPEGALVYGCLLHIAGRVDAAQFWWQFAAGGGSYTAATCLCLLHRGLGEWRDAQYWRDQVPLLEEQAGRRTTRPLHSRHPLLPEEVRRDILAQTHRGRTPRLPPALEAVVKGLPVAEDDPDFGEIPQPGEHLLDGLRRAGRRFTTTPADAAPDPVRPGPRHLPDQNDAGHRPGCRFSPRPAPPTAM